MERTIPADNRQARRVYDAYHVLVRTVVGRILARAGTAEDVEECAQDVLWEFLQGPDKWDPSKGSEKTYLCMLARSRAKNRRKQLLAGAAEPLEEHTLAFTVPDGAGWRPFGRSPWRTMREPSGPRTTPRRPPCGTACAGPWRS